MSRHIYFAGEGLVGLSDTKMLVLKHRLIWRAPGTFPNARPGERLLFAYWRGLLRDPRSGFVPLLMCRLRTPAADEAGLGLPACMGTIPPQLRPSFLAARPGHGGDGYRAQDNPAFAAICVDVETDLLQGGNEDSSHTATSYGFDRGATGRKAWWLFDPGRLRAPLLPQHLHP